MTEKGRNANPGDLVKIKTAKKEIKGMLLESHEAGVLLIKLDSGYNIGIDRSNILNLKIIKKADKNKKESKEKEFKLSGKKPIIDLIMTGGTISSSLDAKTGGVKWLTSPDEFFKFYPDIFELADIRVINPFMKASENMSSLDWMRIAKLVAKSLNNENVKGVIVTHGTDFLHYTSAALSFMLGKINKPVVLTYSQRSTDRGSSDAELNLYCSAKIALSDVAEVMLVGHADSSDEFCYALPGTKVRKLHTSRRDAFKSVNSRPIAKIFRDKIEILKVDYNRRGKANKKIKANTVFEDKVALIKFYPGQDPGILNYYAKKKCRGIVIEMSGLGHVLTEGSKNWIPVIKELVKKGVVICAVAQTIYGRLDPLVYSPGRELEKAGIIYLKDMLAECALVKLGWVLGESKNSEEIRRLMLENISGEFNERLGEDF